MISALPSIAEHRWLRFLVLFILYLAQGVPYGLLLIALPAWLVNGGVGAVELGLYVSAASLPWTLKFMHGFFMDRYTFLPMGRRRPWLIGAQLAMVLALLLIVLLEPSVDELSLLAALGFAAMLATTVQDVAVDGMAVDLLKDGERAKANGLMFGAQAVGIAAGGAVSGWLISQTGGLAAAMFAVAAFIALAVVMMLLLRERPGERLMPWSPGQGFVRASFSPAPDLGCCPQARLQDPAERAQPDGCRRRDPGWCVLGVLPGAGATDVVGSHRLGYGALFLGVRDGGADIRAGCDRAVRTVDRADRNAARLDDRNRRDGVGLSGHGAG